MFVKINSYKVKRDGNGSITESVLTHSKTYDVKSAEFIYDTNEPEEGENKVTKLDIVFADDINNCTKLTESILNRIHDYSTSVYFMNENGKTIDSFEF